MTQPTDNIANDTASEPRWVVTRPRHGDVQVRWEDLTLEEQQDAILHHNQIYGVET
jgi:hypothetical protein